MACVRVITGPSTRGGRTRPYRCTRHLRCGPPWGRTRHRRGAAPGTGRTGSGLLRSNELNFSRSAMQWRLIGTRDNDMHGIGVTHRRCTARIPCRPSSPTTSGTHAANTVALSHSHSAGHSCSRRIVSSSTHIILRPEGEQKTAGESKKQKAIHGPQERRAYHA